ncbi:hypothetical protein BT96DRAFT_983062 [Gymnopus androsaceus JB14]|uniref:Uncharacterized protein n=1 Tax=Gymnopus androsaceus JB14 TaxID=1447944 RepID=A0A6A4IKZ7_9AGAR|nr:hypothetical protein BT96DRAFT_983062 [Gymnopus androsaceus JB14]
MTISTQVHYIPSDNPSIPAFAFQITQLVDSYMLWVAPTDLFEGDVERAPLQGNLCRDWACAMPPKGATTQATTSIFRTSNADASLSMAQRLARRFGKQVFLSIDIQSYAGKPEILLAMEKGILERLKGISA